MFDVGDGQGRVVGLLVGEGRECVGGVSDRTTAWFPSHVGSWSVMPAAGAPSGLLGLAFTLLSRACSFLGSSHSIDPTSFDQFLGRRLG